MGILGSSEKGMTMLEVLVAAGLIALMSLLVMGVNSLLLKSTEYGTKSQALMSLSNLIRQNLNYSDLCNRALASPSGNNQGGFSLANPEIIMSLPNIRSGPTMNGNTISQNTDILPLGIHIDSLRLGDLTNIAGTTRYVGQVLLQTTDIGTSNLSRKAIPISTVILDLTGASPNMSINSCFGVESGVSQSMCTSMGCTWSTTSAPNCQCLGPNGICPLGELPIAIKNGIPDCRPLGGKACGPTEYLVGVGIESSICAPVY